MATVFVTALALAACGGGTAGQPTQGAGQPTAGAGEATAGPGPTTPTGAGGATDDPCALLTAEEAAGALDTDPLSITAVAGDPAKCSYALASGEEVLVVDVLSSGAAAQFQAYVDAGSAESISGVGDAALFEPSSRRLVFTSRDLFFGIFSRYVAGTDAARVATTAIGKIIVARLTTGSVPPDIQLTAPPVLSAATACDLLSADEAAEVLGVGPMEAQGNEFTAQFCTYAVTSSGEVVLSTYLDPKGGLAAWDGFAGSLTTDPVDGLGDRAMFEPSTGILFVLKGDSIINVNVFGKGASKALELDRQLMEIMIANL
jgi:hypothetical protein